jgi:hypothetical protein
MLHWSVDGQSPPRAGALVPAGDADACAQWRSRRVLRLRALQEGRGRLVLRCYVLDVTYKGKDGKTRICPRAEAKVEHAAPGKPWKYAAGRDMNCEDILDAN